MTGKNQTFLNEQCLAYLVIFFYKNLKSIHTNACHYLQLEIINHLWKPMFGEWRIFLLNEVFHRLSSSFHFYYHIHRVQWIVKYYRYYFMGHHPSIWLQPLLIYDCLLQFVQCARFVIHAISKRINFEWIHNLVKLKSGDLGCYWKYSKREITLPGNMSIARILDAQLSIAP